MVKRFSYETDGNLKLSEHFVVKEFASVNGKRLYCDDVLIDTEIIDLLEKLFAYMKASKIIITSGYRCTQHEKEVGNASGKGYHTTGQAIDINVWKNNSTRYTQKEIVLALEDLEWRKGIGLINSDTAVHIDNRATQYYFDERNGNRTIGTSFYKHYGVKKETELDKAVDKLANANIITSADYWKNKKERIKNISQFNNNVDSLIIKVASKI